MTETAKKENILRKFELLSLRYHDYSMNLDAKPGVKISFEIGGKKPFKICIVMYNDLSFQIQFAEISFDFNNEKGKFEVNTRIDSFSLDYLECLYMQALAELLKFTIYKIIDFQKLKNDIISLEL